jgi:nucleoid-associated protein YgaU
VSGAVRSRAEVPFSVPAPLNVATAEQGDGLPVPAAAAPMPPPASPHQAPRRNSVARAFPPAPTEGSTGAGPSPVPASPADTSPPSHTTPSPGPGFASRQNEVGAVVVPEVTTAIVSRGDNLWGISKRTYGRGTRYTVIYGANLPQIRNPSLIYPGQVFVLPPSENQAAH